MPDRKPQRRRSKVYLWTVEHYDVTPEQDAAGRLRGSPSWQHKPEHYQKITYCNPLESKFIDNFILLPKNRKSHAARLLTFTPALRRDLQASVRGMGSLNMDAQDSPGFADIVCQSGLVNPDYRGWLLDVTSGQRRWCVVADMLFCMFQGQHEERPVRTLLLPGHDVKGIVYNSAKRGAFPEPSHGDRAHLSRAHKHTISGQKRYQFTVENQCTQEELVFGAESQDELDVWISILKVATNLDTDILDTSSSDSHSGSYDPSIEEPPNSTSSSDSRKSGSSTNSKISGTSSESRRSTTTSDSRKSVLEAPVPVRYRPSMLRSATIDNSDVCNGDVNTTHTTHTSRTTHATNPNQLHRQKIILDESDLPPSGFADEPVPSAISRAETLKYHPTPPVLPRRLERNLSRADEGEEEGECELSRASGPVFARIIRCNSCKELRHNVTLNPPEQKPDKEKKAKVTKVLKRQSSFDNLKALLRRKRGDKEEKAARVARSRSEVMEFSHSTAADMTSLTQSLPASLTSSPAAERPTSPTGSDAPGGGGGGGSRGSIGSRLAQKASSLKDRMFGTRSRPEAEGNARLGALVDILHSGFLHHKHLLKWVRVWCVVANGYMYAYRSCFPAEAPITSVLLKDCSLSREDGEKSKRALCFKLCQLNVRGLYFSDEDTADFARWMEVLTLETSTYESFQHGLALSPRDSIDSMISSDSAESGKGSQSPGTQGQMTEGRTPALTGGRTPALAGNPASQPLKIRIPVSAVMRKTKRGPVRARSQASFFDSSPSLTTGPSTPSTPTTPASVVASSPRSAKFEAACALQETVIGRTRTDGTETVIGRTPARSPTSLTEGTESGFSSWTENHLRGHHSQDSFSLSSPGPLISDTDSDYPDSTFDDDLQTPDSMTSSLMSSLASSMTSPGLRLSASSLETSMSPKLDSVKTKTTNTTTTTSQSSKDQSSQGSQGSQGSQLSLFRSQVVTLPNKPNQTRFNKTNSAATTDDVTEPEVTSAGESVSDETKRHLLELRRISLSDGNLPAPVIDRLRALSEGRQVSRAPSSTPRAARDISTPSISGYLDRKHLTHGWDNVWCVIKDGVLYIYASPIDDSAMDTIVLAGYDVTRHRDGSRREEFILELRHQDYKPELYRADCEENMDQWNDAMHVNSQKLSLEGLDLDEGHSAEFDNTKGAVEAVTMATERQWEQELLQMKKQQLLQEVLGQKMQLEAQLKQQEKSSSDSNISDSDKLIREVVQLKQRKASLSIKMGGVQKALTVYQNQRKKKKFRLPGSKSPKPDADRITPDEEFLTHALRDLSGELDALERDLEGKMESSRLMASLPEQELQAVKDNMDKEPISPLGLTFAGGKSKDRKNKYSGALKFLNPSGGSDSNFRRRANTYAAGQRSDKVSDKVSSGSVESLRRSEQNSSSESLQLLKKLNEVSAENAELRHTWSSDRSPPRSNNSPSATPPHGSRSSLLMANGNVKLHSNGSVPGKKSPSPSEKTSAFKRRSGSDPSFPPSEPGFDLNIMTPSRDAVPSAESSPSSPESPDRKHVSTQALSYIAEFEELLRENNVPVI